MATSGYPKTRFAELEGAEPFCDWFGTREPYFHDANVLALEFAQGGPSRVVLHAFRMTDQVDDAGYFVLDRHCEVSLVLTGIDTLEFARFDEGAILSGLTVTFEEGKIVVDLESVVGAEGRISAANCRVEFAPRTPAAK